MPAPLLRPLSAAPSSVRPLLPTLPADLPAFVVVAEGDFGGHRFAAGDVVVCRGEAVHGDATVLVPCGHGRPRLGAVHGTTLRGDAGEPCSAVRWQAAGKLVACYRLGVDGWVAHLLAPVVDEVAGAPQSLVEAHRGSTRAEGSAAAQLPLFAA